MSGKEHVGVLQQVASSSYPTPERKVDADSNSRNFLSDRNHGKVFEEFSVLPHTQWKGVQHRNLSPLQYFLEFFKYLLET